MIINKKSKIIIGIIILALVPLRSKSYRKTLEKYYNGVVNKNIEAIVNNSIDLRYDNKEDYKNLLNTLFTDSDDDVMINKYEILNDKNPYDNRFVVRQYFNNGDIVDLKIKVAFIRNKVLTGGELEKVSTYVKKVSSSE